MKWDSFPFVQASVFGRPRIVLFFRDRFDEYLRCISVGLFRPQRRFLRDVVFGLLHGRSVLLSEIGRALREPVALIYTEKRLSRQLGSLRLHDGLIRSNYLRHAQIALLSNEGGFDTIAVDTTDIQKPYGRAMAGLRTVRDGSATTKQSGPGYELLTIEAVGAERRRLPLTLELVPDPEYGQTVVDFALSRIAVVKGFTRPSATWVLDRGFDDRRALDGLHELAVTFAIRVRTGKNSRALWLGAGESAEFLRVQGIVEKCEPTHKHSVYNARWYRMRFGWRAVRLPTRGSSGQVLRNKPPEPRWMTLVFAKRPSSKHPMAILTNARVRNADDARGVIDAYMARWAVEESHRFYKETFDLENIRVLSLRSIRRMLLAALLSYGFLCQLLHFFREQAQEAVANFKAFGRPPRYLVYRLAGEITTLFRYQFDGPP